MERFKELELERYKLLERDRVNKDFNKKLSEYETEYRLRLDSLHRREVESARAVDKLVSAFLCSSFSFVNLKTSSSIILQTHSYDW